MAVNASGKVTTWRNLLKIVYLMNLNLNSKFTNSNAWFQTYTATFRKKMVKRLVVKIPIILYSLKKLQLRAFFLRKLCLGAGFWSFLVVLFKEKSKVFGKSKFMKNLRFLVFETEFSDFGLRTKFWILALGRNFGFWQKFKIGFWQKFKIRFQKLKFGSEKLKFGSKN